MKKRTYKKIKHFLFKKRHFLHKKFGGISLHRDDTFIPNLIGCFGVVFVWRGMWNLIDTYFLPELQIAGNALAILIGVFLLYLPDSSFRTLGGYKRKHKKSDNHKVGRIHHHDK